MLDSFVLSMDGACVCHLGSSSRSAGYACLRRSSAPEIWVLPGGLAPGPQSLAGTQVICSDQK